MTRQILLFNDFGAGGPYVGQMISALGAQAPAQPVVSVQHDAPRGDPYHSAYLLASLVDSGPADAVWVCVVDPGVGGSRRALQVRADGRWLVGPDNGLLVPALRRAQSGGVAEIRWCPEQLSASFHGRDLFAPVAARIALGEPFDLDVIDEQSLIGADWPQELAEVIYVDDFGNAMTGLDAAALNPAGFLQVAGRRIGYRRTFCDAVPDEPFWYMNSLGLVEIAVNMGRADAVLGIGIGAPVSSLD